MKKNRNIFLILGSIFLGILGFLPSLLSLVGVNSNVKLNKDYYKSKDESLFTKKEIDKK